MLSLLFAVAIFAADATPSDGFGVAGGITGIASVGFIMWLIRSHRDERDQWNKSAAEERRLERENCDEKINVIQTQNASLQSQMSQLWARIAPVKGEAK